MKELQITYMVRSFLLTNHSRKTLRFLQEVSEKILSCDPEEITWASVPLAAFRILDIELKYQ